MDFYIESGRTLNDKDRTNNSDLAEIHEFFKPIDRLFGDYEIRKKYGLEESLYRKTIKGDIVKITKEDILKNFRGDLLCFFVYQAQSGYAVNYYWENPVGFAQIINDDEKLLDDTDYDSRTKELYKSAVTNTDIDNVLKLFPVVQFIVMDPSKLIHACELDEARIISFKNSIIAKCFSEDFLESSKTEKEKYYKSVQYIVDNLKKKNKSFDLTNQDISEDDMKKLLSEFEKGGPLVKLKNFEALECVRIRLGKYEDGRFVLFLHPYASESNNPIRIPQT